MSIIDLVPMENLGRFFNALNLNVLFIWIIFIKDVLNA